MYLNVLMILPRVAQQNILNCRSISGSRCCYQNLESKYSESQKVKILNVINDDSQTLSRFDIAKSRLKKFKQWKTSNGQVNTLSDLSLIEGFTDKTAKKLCDSILNGPTEEVEQISNKIKGQILHPNLKESTIKDCKTVLTVYISVNSVCWTLINKNYYEVVEWQYYGIDYPEGKKIQITDIFDIAWRITQRLPVADIYVMKAEATTLRAAGSDPNNPKVLAVNLQKAQMVSMIVALINARGHRSDDDDGKLKQIVYFLRPTLPYRLHGTLVGNERVSTDQTVEMLLQESSGKSTGNKHVYVPEEVKNMFRTQNELQKDMLGHCLLLSLTFMDLCVYKNKERIAKLIKRTS
ncbi:uncharacterized protein LOC114242218 isoform X2 [Bombyx mandarina]|uniref:Uncharacterized protein LOC114242218 isoform X2 n=1 Tax=Bombyx mandarina TaxID=7092 RepID=A0A6J2JL39_BOMMA|nr:uncharacterized protein LOC114242218 isoform X2 [Bombyx mandarina]